MKLTGLKITEVQDINLGNFALTLEDGTKIVTSVIIPGKPAQDDEDEEPAPKKPAPKKTPEPEDDDEDEDEDEPAPKKGSAKKPAPEPEKDDLTWEDLKGMDEDELRDYIDEEGLDTDPDDYDDDLNGLRKAIAKEQGIEIPKKK